MSVTAAQGFVAAGVSAGIKESGALDLSLVATDDGCAVTAAGVFTTNKMCAAPVQVSRAHLEASGGVASAIILSSGNANAATGHPGRVDAELMCQTVSDQLGCAAEAVLVCSTGLIGFRLPMDAIIAAVPSLVGERGVDGGALAAEAILTTDTKRKESVAHAGAATVGGMAKGAAMLAPNMATMLAVLTTDAEVESDTLRRMLYEGVEASFNQISIDGCTSTNDTVLILASGRAGPVDEADLAAAIASVCGDLAEQMVDDAEGATKVVRVNIVGAVTDADARVAARKVAQSQLVKCSWYGGDPYWGRVASELGSAGVPFDPNRLEVSYGDITLAIGGVDVERDEVALRAYMEQRWIQITCDLGLGSGRAQMLTNDLTHAYIDENRGTS